MNRDDIIRMAKESELWNVIEQHSCEYGDGLPTLDYYHELERFAALVAAQERETYAKMCDELEEDEAAPWQIIKAIRARGDK